jgi:hypothetical protein
VFPTAVIPALLTAASPLPTTPTTLEVTLAIRVAQCPDTAGKLAPARPPEWVEAHVHAVRQLVTPHAIVLSVRTEPFTPHRCEALTREDRDGFARHVTSDRAVTVLVVPRVRDLDVLTYDLQGVHWRAQKRRWIFLTARSRPPTLAHELCHYFGLPHDPAGGNLMTPGPSSPAWRSPNPPRPFRPVLTDQQAKQLRAGIARYLAHSSRAAM